MKTFDIDHDIPLIGTWVTTFPDGIGSAFDAIVEKLPGGFDRPFYGVSMMTTEGISYFAGALEKSDNESKVYQLERITIEKGRYAVEEVNGWLSKIESIKDVFMEMMQDPAVDLSKPCVEWYFNDDKMWCLVKIKS
jgi:predicted transcriptional regulator YdeE